MKNNNGWARFQFFFSVAFTLSIATSANAALIDRGGGLIYDTDMNITWLADANLAASNTFGVSGIGVYGNAGGMTWDTAQTWIGAMNSANYLGFNNWRLPNTLQPDASCDLTTLDGDSITYNCIGSEMGHLFYIELGGAAEAPITVIHNTNFSLFMNIQTYNYVRLYWSGTEYTRSNDHSAWYFDFNDGFQNVADKALNGASYAPFSSDTYDLFAWAVRDGDVAAVPIPTAFLLFGSGLVGLFGFMRRGRPK